VSKCDWVDDATLENPGCCPNEATVPWRLWGFCEACAPEAIRFHGGVLSSARQGLAAVQTFCDGFASDGGEG
jgi:hypothetical protein